MRKSIARSYEEHGGLLLGSIQNSDHQIVVNVETYIDPGPSARKSTIALYMDYDYQVALLKVVRSFHPDVHYIGIWHSHHSNGATYLSAEDIRYFQDIVQDDQYKLDNFLALLVTERDFSYPSAFMFYKDRSDYDEIEVNHKVIRDCNFPMEDLLVKLEDLAIVRWK